MFRSYGVSLVCGTVSFRRFELNPVGVLFGLGSSGLCWNEAVTVLLIGFDVACFATVFNLFCFVNVRLLLFLLVLVVMRALPTREYEKSLNEVVY